MTPQPFALFCYEIGQRVKVKAPDVEGFVTQRCDRGAGQHDYCTVFWVDDKRQQEWLLPHEMEKL